MFVDGWENKTGNDRFHGFVPDVMNHLKKMLDFDYRLYIVPDGQFGAKQPNGEWTGMVGEVLSGVSVLVTIFRVKLHFHSKGHLSLSGVHQFADFRLPMQFTHCTRPC